MKRAKTLVRGKTYSIWADMQTLDAWLELQLGEVIEWESTIEAGQGGNSPSYWTAKALARPRVRLKDGVPFVIFDWWGPDVAVQPSWGPVSLMGSALKQYGSADQIEDEADEAGYYDNISSAVAPWAVPLGEAAKAFILGVRDTVKAVGSWSMGMGALVVVGLVAALALRRGRR